MNSNYEEPLRMLRFRARLVGLHRWFPGLSLWSDKPWIIVSAVGFQAVLFFSTSDFMFFSGRFFSRTGLIKLLANVMTVFFQAVSSYILTQHWARAKEYGSLIESLRNFGDGDKPCLQVIYKKHFDKACKLSKLAQRFISTLDVFAYFNYMGVGCAFLAYLEHTKFPLPTFYELSFLPVSGLGTYAVNFVQQAIFAGKTTINWQLYGCTVFHIAAFLVGKFDSTIEIIASLRAIEEDIGYEAWLKAVVDSMDIIKDKLSLFSDLNSTLFYLQEKTCYFIILASWIIWQIDPSMIGSSMAGMCILLAVGLIVLLNETFLEKFDGLNEALYDLPWYEMPVKQRKDVLLMILSAQNPIVLSSAGINNLTLEWLGSVVNGAYSAAVSVKGLIEI